MKTAQPWNPVPFQKLEEVSEAHQKGYKAPLQQGSRLPWDLILVYAHGSNGLLLIAQRLVEHSHALIIGYIEVPRVLNEKICRVPVVSTAI